MAESPDDVVALPDAFALPRRRYDRLVAERASPAPLREATSVVLVRGDGGGLQVFLLHRVAEMAFAGGMTVFPGGGVDTRDGAAGDVTDDGRFRTAAIRELVEETGVLLAGPADGVDTSTDVPGLADARAALTAGGTDLATALDGLGLAPRPDLLLPWARWVTPELMPTRYDLRFYLAVLPPGQDADGETTEAADAGWATPQEALAAWEAGERSLMPPTWAVLVELAGHADVDALRASVAGRRLDPVTPAPILDDDGRVRLGIPRWARPSAGADAEPTR